MWSGFVLDFGAFALGYKNDRLNNANFYLDCKKRLWVFFMINAWSQKLYLVEKIKKV